MRSGEQRAAALATLALVAVVLVGYAEVIFGGQTFAALEHLGQTLPSRSYLAEALRAGRIPEWWEGVGLGVPFAANPQHSALYPPSWIAAALPLPWSADLLAIAHVLVAGLGASALARRLGADPSGSVLAGAVFMTGGFVASMVTTGAALLALAWVPWVAAGALDLAAAEARRDRIGAAARVAALLGLQLLAGEAAYALVAAALAVGLLAWRAERRWIGIGWLAAAGAAAGLLAAVLLVPALLSSLLGPTGTATGVDLEGLAGIVWPTHAHGDRSLYLGLPALGLAGVAVVRARRRWWLAAMAVGFLGLALGTSTPVYVAYRAVVVPERWLGAPEAYAAGALLLLAALAGIGFGHLATRWRGRRGWALALAAAILVAHSMVEARALVPLVERAAVARAPALLGPLVRLDEGHAGGPPRLHRPQTLPIHEPDEAAARALVQHDTLAANVATRFGLAYLSGGDRGQDPSLERLRRASATAGARLLDLFDVGYAVVPASVAVPAAMPVVSRLGAVALVENRRRRPRAFVAPGWTWHRDDAEILEAMFPADRPGAAPSGYAHIRLSGAPPSGEAPGPALAPSTPVPACDLARPRPEAVHLRCASDAGGYAVLLDAWSPGWSATVAGASVGIERADLVARAVRVPPGEHEVVFRYRSPGLRLGGLVSALAWLELALLLYVVRRRAPAA